MSLQTTMLVCRHHSCSQKTQMQLWWSAAENWLSKVDPTLAFCLAQRVTTMLGTILALKVNMPLIYGRAIAALESRHRPFHRRRGYDDGHRAEAQ